MSNSTTVHYINPDQSSKEIKNTAKDIKIFYLKATISILALALATISAILVWRLMASQNDCEKQSTEPEVSFKDQIEIEIVILH